MKKFPIFRQPDEMDCGPTCLKMLAKYYGRNIGIQKLRSLSETTRSGTNLQNISNAAEKIGFRTLGVKIDYSKLVEEAPLPAIVYWQQKHYVIVYKIKKDIIYIADPAHGLVQYKKDEFIKNWISENAIDSTQEGVVLLIEPTPKLMTQESDDIDKKSGFFFIYKYLFRYKKFLFQLVFGLIAGSLLQLIFPFLTQSIVDIGIQNNDIHFIYLILIAQIFLFIGKSSIELIRSWILLHLSSRINISLISDFFIKLMNLPIAFFDIKMTGDIMQRINDHQKIETLLTSSSLNVLFSMINLIIFGGILAWYSFEIFFIFLIGSVLYFVWITMFLKRRKELDYKKFAHLSNEQSKIIELINGMQEIKLHNAERQKRWSWEYLQAKLFRVELKSMTLEQTQSIGSDFINELKNILITFFSAKLVLDGQITLGMMLSISYIIGQLNSPIQQLIGFVYSVQDARIALDRLSEIHLKDDEVSEDFQYINTIPKNTDLILNNINFRYTGSKDFVLKNISFKIPSNKTTAIVGASGSGKTTLMKILLKFYNPNEGNILIGKNIDLKNVDHESWRSNCGSVMQEGYIFNDTIANNICIGAEFIDKEKLQNAVTVANISDYIDSLPLGYNTKIGLEGHGMSTGQKQRLLIARAVYKNPSFLLFDEATSALDSENEKTIMSNLDEFLLHKTAVVIAHRLSTVKNAHQIVVLDQGEVFEIGTHKELLEKKGKYFSLVKNQLELEKLSNTSENGNKIE